MNKLTNDLFGLNTPYFYRLDIIRDKNSLYVAELSGKHIFTGYYTNNSDILFSKFLVMNKAWQLQDDPRVTDNGNGYVQVYLVDGIRCEQLLIYDSSQSYKGNRGITRPIIDNLKKEIDVLWSYIDKPGREIVLVKDDDENHPYLLTHWSTDDVKPSFLEPMTDENWHIQHPDIETSLRMLKKQKRDAKLGVYWMWGTYQAEQADSKEAA
jgi:hypothetical protein